MNKFNSNGVYDFYGHPPETHRDVRDYLRTWLRPIEEGARPSKLWCGKTWYQTHGFRRAGSIHAAWMEPASGWYAFDAGECDWTEKPNLGVYEGWEEMLDGVAEMYRRLWRIKS